MARHGQAPGQNIPAGGHNSVTAPGGGPRRLEKVSEERKIKDAVKEIGRNQSTQAMEAKYELWI